MRVSARQATEISAFADTGAGNEKGHGVLLGTALRRGLLRECQVRAQECSHRENGNNKWGPRHTAYLRMLCEGGTANQNLRELTLIVKLLGPFARPNG
jgi:hypothetical protein